MLRRHQDRQDTRAQVIQELICKFELYTRMQAEQEFVNATISIHTCLHRIGDRIIEQEIVYEKLPTDIADRYVLLMDPILATGNSAARAIQARDFS